MEGADGVEVEWWELMVKYWYCRCAEMLSCIVYVLGYVDTDPIILCFLYHGSLSVINLSSHGRGCLLYN